MGQLLTIRAAMLAIALEVLIAGVWTQAGYLPHWLFLLTQIGAAFVFGAFAYEQSLLKYFSLVAYHRLTTGAAIGFILLLLFVYMWGSSLGSKPLQAIVVGVLNASPTKNKVPVLVARCSELHPAVHPVPFLFSIQVTNLGSTEQRINNYTIEVSHYHYLPWSWHSLTPLPLKICNIYCLGPFHTAPPPPPTVVDLLNGSYLLASPMGQYLSRALLLRVAPLLDEELARSLPAHESVQGWVASDLEGERVSFRGPHVWFRITLDDAEGNQVSTITQTPIGSRWKATVDIAPLMSMGKLDDLTKLPFRPFGD
jgi:hypothetical protein